MPSMACKRWWKIRHQNCKTNQMKIPVDFTVVFISLSHIWYMTVTNYIRCLKFPSLPSDLMHLLLMGSSEHGLFGPHLYLMTEVDPASEMLCTSNIFKMMDNAQHNIHWNSSINMLNRSLHFIVPYILNHPLSQKAVISRSVVKPW